MSASVHCGVASASVKSSGASASVDHQLVADLPGCVMVYDECAIVCLCCVMEALR